MLLLTQHQIINYFEHIDYTFNFAMYLNFAYSLFLIGIFGMIFNYKNFLITMLTVELMYLGIVSGFIIWGVYSFNVESQIYALVILLLAASESAIGLGMLIVLFRYGKGIEFTSHQELRG